MRYFWLLGIAALLLTPEYFSFGDLLAEILSGGYETNDVLTIPQG
jgi:hypothetical protein